MFSVSGQAAGLPKDPEFSTCSHLLSSALCICCLCFYQLSTCHHFDINFPCVQTMYFQNEIRPGLYLIRCNHITSHQRVFQQTIKPLGVPLNVLLRQTKAVVRKWFEPGEHTTIEKDHLCFWNPEKDYCL